MQIGIGPNGGNSRNLPNLLGEQARQAGMPGASVGTDCADCQICFTADDGAFYLRQDSGWWIVDEVNDRGKLYDGTAKFSTFDLVEKYLIWRWASFAQIGTGTKPFRPELYSSGYSQDVSLKSTGDKWRTEVQPPIWKKRKLSSCSSSNSKTHKVTSVADGTAQDRARISMYSIYRSSIVTFIKNFRRCRNAPS
jgi:hypothetical protein